MNNPRKQAGDTIIEVMAAIAILGLAIGAAFSLSTRSFHSAVSTEEHTEALYLAQGQAEFLKNVGLNKSTAALLMNQNNGAFCFDDSTGNASAAASTSGPCSSYKGSIYNVSITYCSGVGCGQQNANVFTIQTNWTSSGTGTPNNVTIYYKPPS